MLREVWLRHLHTVSQNRNYLWVFFSVYSDVHISNMKHNIFCVSKKQRNKHDLIRVVWIQCSTHVRHWMYELKLDEGHFNIGRKESDTNRGLTRVYWVTVKPLWLAYVEVNWNFFDNFNVSPELRKKFNNSTTYNQNFLNVKWSFFAVIHFFCCLFSKKLPRKVIILSEQAGETKRYFLTHLVKVPCIQKHKPAVVQNIA